VLPHNLAGPGNFESLRHRFPGLAARDWLRHKARKIGAVLSADNCFPGGGPALRIRRWRGNLDS
jgi:hypothetical protein